MKKHDLLYLIAATSLLFWPGCSQQTPQQEYRPSAQTTSKKFDLPSEMDDKLQKMLESSLGIHGIGVVDMSSTLKDNEGVLYEIGMEGRNGKIIGDKMIVPMSVNRRDNPNKKYYFSFEINIEGGSLGSWPGGNYTRNLKRDTVHVW